MRDLAHIRRTKFFSNSSYITKNMKSKQKLSLNQNSEAQKKQTNLETRAWNVIQLWKMRELYNITIIKQKCKQNV